ncbi:MAG: M23 family peptidase, partial [Micromonosporaceae bacterium]|nr:M23 family peptidase [Micromonosporaceae bacterium]
MRRRLMVVASILSATLALSGCSTPPTVGDGRLGVDWAVLPTPSVP